MDLRIVIFRSGRVQRDRIVLTQDDAARLLDALVLTRLRLDGRIRGLLATFDR